MVLEISTVDFGLPKDCAMRDLRVSAGLSRPQLAQRAGIGIATVYELEAGLLDVRLSTLLKVARALNVTPDYLLGLRRQIA